MEKTWEILAPAGSIDQLKAAVNNGCDSVYLGLENFNARMKAPNFTSENLREWVDYCHFFGVKVYVAVNTSIKNGEFAKAWQTVLDAYGSYADGVIVTDLALLKLASQLPKPFEIAASTQLNVHDKYGAEFVKKLGATTVVCARECSFEQIAEIAKTGVTVECFLHGANCVCQSGQCLFSSLVGGNSGNRGLCAQPCRKLYRVKNGKNSGYLLSAHDTCGLDTARKMLELGVRTFKIEGRNRRAEYAGVTSRIYGEYFASNFAKKPTYSDDLAEVFNRALAPNAYLFGKNDGIIFKEVQSHSGVCIGAVKDNGFIADCPVCKGDGLKVFDDGKEVCGGVVLESGTGFIKASFSQKVRDGMPVHRTTSIRLAEQTLSARRKLAVEMRFIAKAGEKALLIAEYNGISVSVESESAVAQAVNLPTGVEEITKQLRKTADLPYTISNIVYEIDEIFLAKSSINALRRDVLQKLTQAIVSHYNGQFADRKNVSVPLPAIIGRQNKPSVAVICRTQNELQTAKSRADLLIYKPEVISTDVLRKVFDCFVDLPAFADCNYLSKLNFAANRLGIVCHNVGQVEFARQNNLPYIAGSGLNIFNDCIADVFSDAVTFVYSQELSLEEISRFTNRSGYVFVDGKLTLMKLVHCPFKVAYGCDCGTCRASVGLVYVDEFGNEFVLNRRKDKNCSFELVNGKKVSAASRIVQKGRYLIDYDDKVLAHYSALNDGVNDGYVESRPYTKARLFAKIN